MTYRIKEIFFTQQGEGKNTGKDFQVVIYGAAKKKIEHLQSVHFATQIFMEPMV